MSAAIGPGDHVEYVGVPEVPPGLPLRSVWLVDAIGEIPPTATGCPFGDCDRIVIVLRGDPHRLDPHHSGWCPRAFRLIYRPKGPAAAWLGQAPETPSPKREQRELAEIRAFVGANVIRVDR